MDDRDLLSAYVSGRSEEAFATLVQRYVDLVYSAALRQVRNPDQAQDVTQAVFLILARKAGSISRKTILSGWLYRTARYVAFESVRADTRRKIRESNMAELNAQLGPDCTEESWKRISPHLDRVMEQLSEPDRTAVLLRFFQGKSFRELAEILGIGEEAAKKRVGRALDRLRRRLARLGIRDSTTVLGTVLTAFAIQPAPASLAGAIPSLVFHGTVTAASTQILMEGALHMVTWTKIKTAAACAAALLLTVGTTTISIQNAQLSRDQARLQREGQQLQTQSRQVEAKNQQTLVALRQENQELRQQATNLQRLRNAVAQLQGVKSMRASYSGAVRLDAFPEQLRQSAESLRELQFEKFIAAGSRALIQAPLTENERAEYFEEINFMKQIGMALRIYATDHGDEFPETIDQLLGTGILQDNQKERLRDSRYEYLRFGKAEQKPNLPAVWWRAPDERGVRILVFNDGSAQMIREPQGVETPGLLLESASR